MTTPLKPCPFCRYDRIHRSSAFKLHFRTCPSCGVQTRPVETPERADLDWNHRPGEQAVAEECAKLAEGGYVVEGGIGASWVAGTKWAADHIAKLIRARFGGTP